MKLLFLGDFFYDYDGEVRDISRIAGYLAEQDCKVIVNLETAVFSCGKPIKKRGPNLKSTPVLVDLLKKMHCACVCLANNHAMDFGEASLVATMERLEGEGIACVGAGRNLEEATRHARLCEAGETVLLQNFGWDVEETVYASAGHGGCAPLNREYVMERTRELRARNPEARLVNIFHWGFEYNALPMPRDIQLAHDCVRAGCDLIVGHHPHVVQPFEIFEGAPIFYSLGNFYFGSRRDAFPTCFSNEPRINCADYGLGLLWDTQTGEHRAIGVEYDRAAGETTIGGDAAHILSELDADSWRREDYAALARRHAYKPNPILGLDERENRRLLRILKLKYGVAAQFRKLERWPLARHIYDCLKSRA